MTAGHFLSVIYLQDPNPQCLPLLLLPISTGEIAPPSPPKPPSTSPGSSNPQATATGNPLVRSTTSDPDSIHTISPPHLPLLLQLRQPLIRAINGTPPSVASQRRLPSTIVASPSRPSPCPISLGSDRGPPPALLRPAASMPSGIISKSCPLNPTSRDLPVLATHPLHLSIIDNSIPSPPSGRPSPRRLHAAITSVRHLLYARHPPSFGEHLQAPPPVDLCCNLTATSRHHSRPCHLPCQPMNC